jgi:hypothetical protein
MRERDLRSTAGNRLAIRCRHGSLGLAHSDSDGAKTRRWRGAKGKARNPAKKPGVRTKPGDNRPGSFQLSCPADASPLNGGALYSAS